MTADTHFKDFVQRQQRPDSVNDVIDWQKERDEWLLYLNQLYDDVAKYLFEYVESGEITLQKSSVELNEENIGAYNATKLIIIIGAQKILLNPIGTMLIGSKGGVDVKGSAGNSRLVLINKDITHAGQMLRVTITTIPPEKSLPPQERPPLATEIEWVWKILSRPPTMQFIELNKESLFEMLMEVSNG